MGDIFKRTFTPHYWEGYGRQEDRGAGEEKRRQGRKGFGKKYDKNLSDLPTDEATLKERQEHERFFKEMRKREF